MKIDPRHLEQLGAIVEHGTLQETAKRLGTSQPALSRMIANLESRLGITLFERSSRPLIPTEVGRKLANHGQTISSTRQRASEDVQLALRGQSGELKIGAPPFLCERLVGDAISSFLSQRSGTEVTLVSEYLPHLERLLLLNQLDIAICPLRLLDSSQRELMVEPLFRDRHVIVCRHDHPLITRENITARELEQETWISHAEQSMLRRDMSVALATYGVRNLKISFESASAGAIFEMLRNSDFLTVLPRYAVRGLAAKDRLGTLPVQFDEAAMLVGIVTSRGRVASPLLNAFLDHMRGFVSDELPDMHRLED